MGGYGYTYQLSLVSYFRDLAAALFTGNVRLYQAGNYYIRVVTSISRFLFHNPHLPLTLNNSCLNIAFIVTTIIVQAIVMLV